MVFEDGEGVALLADAWRMASQWIEMERGKSADVLLEAALALANFVGPLVINTKPPSNVFALMHSPSGTPLIDQIFGRVSPNVKRIGIIGAFLDKELALITELARRWPKAEVAVGIDPGSVQLLGTPTPGVARYVDARDLWPKSQSYLYAKAVYFDMGDDGNAFVSGSANPSRPAWMGQVSRDNTARAELEQSIARTVRPTPEAALRATNWLARHLHFGDEWGNGFCESDALLVGGYCYVPGVIDEPRVALEVSGDVVDFWDYDQVQKFARDRVLGAMPAI